MKKSFILLTIISFFATCNFLNAQSTKKSKTEYNNYGGNVSFGLAIGGGGIIGVPVRVRLAKSLVAELGIYYRPILLFDEYRDEISFSHGVMLAGGFNFFLGSKLKEYKGKYKKHGIFLKGGHSFSSFSDSFVGVGWVSETFRIPNSKKSFIFELGPGVLISHWVDDPENYRYSGQPVSFLIYWKVHWNWYN